MLFFLDSLRNILFSELAGLLECVVCFFLVFPDWSISNSLLLLLFLFRCHIFFVLVFDLHCAFYCLAIENLCLRSYYFTIFLSPHSLLSIDIILAFCSRPFARRAICFLLFFFRFVFSMFRSQDADSGGENFVLLLLALVILLFCCAQKVINVDISLYWIKKRQMKQQLMCIRKWESTSRLIFSHQKSMIIIGVALPTLAGKKHLLRLGGSKKTFETERNWFCTYQIRVFKLPERFLTNYYNFVSLVWVSSADKW